MAPLPSQVQDPDYVKQKEKQKKLIKDVEKAAEKQLEQIRPKSFVEHFEN